MSNKDELAPLLRQIWKAIKWETISDEDKYRLNMAYIRLMDWITN